MAQDFRSESFDRVSSAKGSARQGFNQPLSQAVCWRALSHPWLAVTRAYRSRHIDTGLLLIGLYECLGELDEAETALRDIVVLFLCSLHLPEEAQRGIYPKRLDLRHQLEMLEIWTRQHRGESPWEPVLCFAARLLFPDQTEPTTTQIGKALSADAWALYSKTLSFFGRALDDARVVDSSTDRNSPAPGSSMRAA